METRTALVAATMVLLLVIGGVQALDPQFGRQHPPPVNFSEPPAEVAADAATQFEYVDYAYRIDIAYDRGDEWRQVRTMRVDHTDREYHKVGPAGERGVVLYGTDAITFVRPGTDAPWRVTAVPDTLYPAGVISQPFITRRIRTANASILFENSTVMIIHVDVHPLRVAGYLPGYATLRINKHSGLVEQANVAYNVNRTNTRFLQFQITETNIDVGRPASIPFSPREVVWDLLRGPLFKLFGPRGEVLVLT